MTAYLNVMAYNIGAGKFSRVAELNRVAHWIADVLGIALAGICVGLSKYIIMLFNTDQEFIDYATVPIMLGFFGAGFASPSMLCGAHE